MLRIITARYIRFGQFRNISTINQRLDNEQSSQNDQESHSSSESSDSDDGSDDIKNKILKSSLQFVPQYGWSRESLAAGARSVGLSSAASGLFPDGGVEIAHFFYRHSNSELVKHLTTMVTITDGKVKRSIPMNQFMEDAVKTRLQMIIPYQKNWHQAMALMSTPFQAPVALKNLQTLVDDIWYYAGDTSTDFNWYTKRIMLAGVYKLTELCLIQDTSEDFSDTWSFLNRRLSDLSTFSSTVRQLKQSGDLSAALFETAQSMIGLRSTK